MGADRLVPDNLVLWIVGAALCLFGIAVLALLAIWLPHFIRVMLQRDDEE